MTETAKYRDHPQQRRALHKWFQLFADTLNKADLDMRVVLKESVPIKWNKDGVKEYIFKPVLEAAKGYESTEDQETTDIDEIIDYIIKHFGERFEVELPPFPSKEDR